MTNQPPNSDENGKKTTVRKPRPSRKVTAAKIEEAFSVLEQFRFEDSITNAQFGRSLMDLVFMYYDLKDLGGVVSIISRVPPDYFKDQFRADLEKDDLFAAAMLQVSKTLVEMDIISLQSDRITQKGASA